MGEAETVQCGPFTPHSLERLSMQHLKAIHFKLALDLFQLVDKYSIKCEAVASVPYLSAVMRQAWHLSAVFTQ